MSPTTTTIIAAKENLGLSWEEYWARWRCLRCGPPRLLGMNSMPCRQGQRLCELLKLDNAVSDCIGGLGSANAR